MSSLYSDADILRKNQEKENRLKRIQEAKDLDIKISRQLVHANREVNEQIRQQEEYKGALEEYKNILQMIEELKKSKELYIQKQAESEIEKQKEQEQLYKNMLETKEKKRQFEIFLKQKGIEASKYLKDLEEKKNRKHEELHRFERRKQTKEDENIKTKKVIDNYLIKKEKEMYEERMNAQNPGTMDVLYTITNPFHNNGNKIDYSTTRFHNVTVERHDNNLPNTLDLKINAFDKAKVEAENTKKILNDKNNRLKEFKKNEKMNYREQINKNRAKEGLEKLNNEIQQLNRMKRGDKNNQKKRIDINANVNNAKQNDRKAEHIMNKLLEGQKGNRGKIYGGSNNLQIVTSNANENNGISDDSLTNFYKDKKDVYDINENEILNKINIDDDDTYDMYGNGNKNKSKNKKVKKYEEPVVRDRKPKPEVINRLSPVDLPSYQKVELDQVSEYEHRKPLVKNQVFVLNKKQNKSNSKYYVEDIPKQTSDFNLLNELQLNNNINSNNINNNINSNNNYNSGIINNNEMNDVKMFINQINSNTSASTNNYNNMANNLNSNNNAFMPNTVNNNNFNIVNSNTNFNQGVSIPNINNNMDMNNYNNYNNGMIDNNVNEGQNQKKEEKDKKWKYNKQELYERKKKMLKDKSNFK